MATLTITTRRVKSGKRYAVRYRLGGRAYPVEHGGSFQTLKEARTRRDLIAGELAAGRNPQIVLQALLNPPALVKVEKLREVGPRYLTSRVDLDEKTEKAHRSALERIYDWAGDRDPHSLSFQDCQVFVGVLNEGDEDHRPLKPGTVSKYFNVLKLLLDFAGCDPNPARDSRVKKPKVVSQEPNPPTGKQFLTILDNVGEQWVLPFVTQEQTGTYLDEILSLAWGDVDVAERKFRLRFEYVKAGIRTRARTLQVPDWLMDAIEATCPLEDRTAERKVFMGLKEDTGRRIMARACRDGRIPHFSPKNLRERRASIWHHGGLPAKVLAERLGHSKASMSLDVYSHTLDPGEVKAEQLRSRL
jgi:integrase